jgi:hypothetical protein
MSVPSVYAQESATGYEIGGFFINLNILEFESDLDGQETELDADKEPIIDKEEFAHSDEWEFELTPYIHFPSADFDSTVQGQTQNVDLSFGDIIDEFDIFSASAHFEGFKGNWGFIINSGYSTLNGDFDLGPLIDLDVDIVDTAFDIALSHRFDPLPLQDERKYPNLVFYTKTGVRYRYLRQKIDIDPGPRLGDSYDWVEPVVGGRVRLHTSKKLFFNLAADFAGFGVGSATDITFNLLGGVAYSLSEQLMLKAGYYYQYTDYSRGSGFKEFGLEGELQGPIIGVGWRF